MIYMQGQRGSYRQGPLQQGPLHDIQAKGPIQIGREPLKTRAHADRGPCRKWLLQTKRSYRQGVLTYKGPLQIKGPYRQGSLTDKEFIQTKGLYSKFKGPL